MKNSYLFTQPLMELDNELIQNLIRKEGLKGYGAYIVLNDALRKLDGFRMAQFKTSVFLISIIGHSDTR